MPRVRRLLACLMGVWSLAWNPPPISAQMTPGLQNLPEQRVAPGDLLGLTVYGVPEMSRSARVDERGSLRLPMMSRPVAVSGLLPAEIEALIGTELEEAGILVQPSVTVTIVEYRSRPISVAGAVKTPITFQAVGKVTLLEAITRAQGLSETAGSEILVSRPHAGTVDRISVAGLLQSADPVLNLQLEGGEEIRVPAVGRVFVVGNVKHPGAYRTDDGAAVSVLKALALAEGLSPFAEKVAYIYRGNGLANSEIPIELRKILDRKSPDVNLSANDILYVPDNRARRLTSTAIERAIGFASATASGALILGVNR